MRDQFAPVRRRSAARHSPFIWARRVLIVVALGATIYIVVPQLADLGQAAAALAHVQPFHIVGGLLLEALSYLSVAQLYRTILADVGAPISLGVAIETTMAVQAVTHIVPVGTAAGLALDVDLMHEQGVPGQTTGEAQGIQTLLVDLALFLMFFVGLAGSIGKPGLSAAYVVSAIGAMVLGIVLSAVVLVCARRPSLAQSVAARVARFIRRFRSSIDPDKVGRKARDMAIRAQAVLRGRYLLVAIGLALAYWVADLLVLFVFFLALGHYQNLGVLTVSYTIAYLLGAVSPTPGGLGVVEATLIGLSIAFGAPKHIAILAVLGYRLVNYWLPLPVGGCTYLALLRRKHQHPGAPERAARPEMGMEP